VIFPPRVPPITWRESNKRDCECPATRRFSGATDRSDFSMCCASTPRPDSNSRHRTDERRDQVTERDLELAMSDVQAKQPEPETANGGSGHSQVWSSIAQGLLCGRSNAGQHPIGFLKVMTEFMERIRGIRALILDDSSRARNYFIRQVQMFLPESAWPESVRLVRAVRCP
jgi:hypothetical protein